jgi:hypothetical protein
MNDKLFNHPITRRKFMTWSINQTVAIGLGAALIGNSKTAFAFSGGDIGELPSKSTGKTWGSISELSSDDLSKYQMDISPWEKTPRNEKYPYVAAAINAAPYTAAAIIYRMMIGQHFPWWTHESPIGGIAINNIGGINRYKGQREVWSAMDPESLEDYLYQWPEDKVCMWIWDRYYSPIRTRYNKLLQNYYRAGETSKKSSEKWEYLMVTGKVDTTGRTYKDQYNNSLDYQYGDVMMVPWYYTFRFVGVDTLYSEDTIRFPKGRTKINRLDWDAKPVQLDVDSMKPMGESYPAYTKDGGVPCYVIEATVNQNAFAQNASKVLLWVDMHAFRELRRERYDLNNELETVTTAIYHQERKDKGAWGYSILIYLAWRVSRDHMTAHHYDFHRTPKTFTVDPEHPENYFKPNPVSMASQMFPVPQSIMLPGDPEQFYLRPKLMLDKFPQDRNIKLSEKMTRLINGQNKGNQLVFL